MDVAISPLHCHPMAAPNFKMYFSNTIMTDALTCGKRILCCLHMRQFRDKLFNITDGLRSMSLLDNVYTEHHLHQLDNTLITLIPDAEFRAMILSNKTVN